MVKKLGRGLREGIALMHGNSGYHPSGCLAGPSPFFLLGVNRAYLDRDSLNYYRFDHAEAGC